MTEFNFKPLESEGVEFFLGFGDEIESNLTGNINKCEENGSILSHINNLAEFNFVKTMIEDSLSLSVDADVFFIYLGYDGGLNDSISLTSRYKTFDETGNLSFIENAEEFPWQDGQPDGLNENGRCVFWIYIIAENSHAFLDTSCNFIDPFLCRRNIEIIETDSESDNEKEEFDTETFEITELKLLFSVLFLILFVSLVVAISVVIKIQKRYKKLNGYRSPTQSISLSSIQLTYTILNRS